MGVCLLYWRPWPPCPPLTPPVGPPSFPNLVCSDKENSKTVMSHRTSSVWSPIWICSHWCKRWYCLHIHIGLQINMKEQETKNSVSLCLTFTLTWKISDCLNCWVTENSMRISLRRQRLKVFIITKFLFDLCPPTGGTFSWTTVTPHHLETPTTTSAMTFSLGDKLKIRWPWLFQLFFLTRFFYFIF